MHNVDAADNNPMSLALDADTIAREQRNAALTDLYAGLNSWPLWFTIGWLDIRQRYRRSRIGPFWITLSVAIFVTGLGIVYSALFHMNIHDYLPFLATGMIIWTLIASLLQDGCTAFIAAEGAIKQIPVPVSVHVYRMVWRNLIIFGHNILIYVVLVVLFDVKIGPVLLLVPLGLLVITVTGVGFGLTLGVVSARFRDIPVIMANIVQLIFFTTPIFWRPESLSPEHIWVASANPFFRLIQIVRQPLLGEVPSAGSWGIAIAFAAASLAMGIFMYMRFRARIAYWL